MPNQAPWVTIDPPTIPPTSQPKQTGGILDFSNLPNAFSTSQGATNSQSNNFATNFGNNFATNFGNTSSNSYSGIKNPFALNTLNGLFGQFSGMLPGYQNALQQSANLPGNIDKWTQNLVSGINLKRDDIVNTLNSVANARGNQGIVSGTESENLRANLLGLLGKDVMNQQNTALTNAMGLKSNAIMQQPGLAQQPMSILAQLLGLSQESTGTSAGQSGGLSLGQSGGLSTGSSTSQGLNSSYSTDPSAQFNLISNLLRAGYTG